MTVNVRLVLDEGNLKAQLSGPAGMVTQYVLRTVGAIRTRAVMYCPVRTGNLRNSLTTAIRADGMTVVGTVGTPVDYAVEIHEGRRAGRRRVSAHQVREHTVNAPGKRAYTVKTHMRGAHTQSVSATPGRPFIRKAMEDVLGR